MRQQENIIALGSLIIAMLFAAPLYAAAPANQPGSSQSPEAMKQMADQLEADRKARAAEQQQKREAAQQQETVVEEVKPANPRPIIQNRPLPQNQPRPTPLPAGAN